MTIYRDTYRARHVYAKRCRYWRVWRTRFHRLDGP